LSHLFILFLVYSDKIMRVLGKINKTLAGIDPQGTWWQRLILVFHHDAPTSSTNNDDDNNITCGNTTHNDTLDQRFQLVRDTLPSLMQHLSVLPCVILMASSTLTCVDYPQQCRRILYQQLCMHQTDLGWWHGSTPTKETSDSENSDDDKLGALLPVAVMIGKKAKKKKRPLFTIDKIPTAPVPPSQPLCDNDDDDHTKQQQEPSILCGPPAPNSPSVELKHRFSKKWTEAPKRHHTIIKSSPSPSCS
jgi:hypothetical protein